MVVFFRQIFLENHGLCGFCYTRFEFLRFKENKNKRQANAFFQYVRQAETYEGEGLELQI